jgi:hypothetical protein
MLVLIDGGAYLRRRKRNNFMIQIIKKFLVGFMRMFNELLNTRSMSPTLLRSLQDMRLIGPILSNVHI